MKHLGALAGSIFFTIIFLFSSGPPVAAATPQPGTAFSTFLGGGGDSYNTETGRAIAVDASGNIYVAGDTGSPGFPITTNFSIGTGTTGAFVTKVSPTGDQVIYSALIPGCVAEAVGVDSSGNAYVAGYTSSFTLPVTNAYQTGLAGNYDAFIAKLSADGTKLLYCTYFGGTDLDLGTAIAVDASGNAVVTGWTTSTNFPITGSAVQKKLGGSYDAFVAKFDPAGKLVFSTYLGGPGPESGASVALDPQGSIYVTGTTLSTNFSSALNPHWLLKTGVVPSGTKAYVAKLSSNGSQLIYLTLTGGSFNELGAAIAVDASGDAFVLGQTTSDDLPVSTNALQSVRQGGFNSPDNFLMKIDPTGSSIIYDTYLGGSGSEQIYDLVYAGGYYVDGAIAPGGYLNVERAGLTIDSLGNAYVGARTSSSDFALGTTASVSAGGLDGYVAKINSNASALLWFAYVGGSQDDSVEAVAFGPNGLAITGSTAFTFDPPHFPITPGVLQKSYGGSISDVFIQRLADPPSVPVNDNFAKRTMLSGEFLTIQADNTSATVEFGEPAHAGGSGGHSLWWSWTAPTSGRLVVTTQGSGIDTLLDVYTGNALNGLQNIASNHDVSATHLFSRVIVPVTAGTPYQIAVDGSGGAVGTIRLTLMYSGAVNDDYSQRIVLNGFPVTTTGSNIEATRELDEPYPPGNARQSVWWEWTSPTNGPVAISTEGSDFETYLTVFTNTPPNLSPIAVDGRHDLRTTSLVTFIARQGTTYAIAVDGVYLDSGNIHLSIQAGVTPTNDNFENAILLTGLTASSAATNNTATLQPGEPSINIANASGPANQTVWWRWTAPITGYATIKTAGSSFDTRLAVYTGNALPSLSLVISNDNSTDLTSSVFFPIQSNTVYSIQVDGNFYSPSGTIQLSIASSTPPEFVHGLVTRLADGNVQMNLLSHNGNPLTLEASTNLINWIVLPDQIGLGGTFTDTNALQFPHRFYRARTAP